MKNAKKTDKAITTIYLEQLPRIVAKRKTKDELIAEAQARYDAAAAHAEKHPGLAKARHDNPSANFWIRELAAMKQAPIVVWPELA